MSGGGLLTFLGGAGTVTGSRFLVESRGVRVLLDCGLFQGPRELRARNWADPPFDVRTLDAVVLTHAHLDHSGWLPVLVRHGYRGPIHCTRPSRDLLEILLLDAARLQEQDAAYANEKGWSRHKPALPLFDAEDVERALGLVVTHRYHERFVPAQGFSCVFRRAGHILGSAIVELTLPDGTTLTDSGDLGRWDQPILRDPEVPERADVLLLESTYGDRLHPTDGVERLAAEVRAAVARGGAILVPAFAVGRSQALVWTLRELEEAGRIPRLAVYLDSPMAERVTKVTCRHREDHDEEMRQATDEARCPLCAKGYRVVTTVEESIALNALDGTFMVLAGSGMLTGGRIVHHLTQRLEDERTTVLLTGFQAAGTRGRRLLDGATSLRLFGREVPVRAHVAVVEGLSAHADRDEILRWLAALPRAPRQVHVVHGEPSQSEGLAVAIRERFGWRVDVAGLGEQVPL